MRIDIKKIPEFPSPKKRKYPKLTPKHRQIIRWISSIIFVMVLMIALDRAEKLKENLHKIYLEHNEPVCEQYALIVIETGYFPCLSCEGKMTMIYLKVGEVWKYGFAGMGGEEARYPGNIFYSNGKIKLTRENLVYTMQIRGTKEECLMEEQRKIFNYPDLPEALARDIQLIRPPGNPQDR